MIKRFLKILLKLVCGIAFCFVTIFILSTVCWDLFDSGHPILIELGISIIAGVFVTAVYETFKVQDKKIKELEDRINKLEEN